MGGNFNFGDEPRRGRRNPFGFISVGIILLLFFGVFIVKDKIIPAVSRIIDGGEIVYDEGTVLEYSSEKYGEIFSESNTPEENILLVFILDGEGEGYCFYPRVGKDFNGDMRYFLLEGDKSERISGLRGIEIDGNNVMYVLDRMDEAVKVSYEGRYDATDISNSKVINESSFDVDKEAYIDSSLKAFARNTGIGIACVFVDSEDLFEREIALSDIITVLAYGAALVIFAVILLLKIKRAKPSEKKGEDFVVEEYGSGDGEREGFGRHKDGKAEGAQADTEAHAEDTERRERDERDFREDLKKYKKKEKEERYKKKDDRYRRGYDKSRYKKK